MKYEVLHTFREKEHDDTVYEVGDTYPKEGYKAEAKRVKYLQDYNQDYRTRFLGEAIEEKKKDDSGSKEDEKSTNKASTKATANKDSDKK